MGRLPSFDHANGDFQGQDKNKVKLSGKREKKNEHECNRVNH